MKLIAELDGERHSLEVQREGGGQVVAVIGGRSYRLEAHEPERGLFLLKVDGRVYECRIEGGEDGARGAVEVHTGQQVYGVALSDPKRLRGVGGKGASASGRAEIKAPIPGKIVRVMVEAGAPVAAGQGLVVVEAMKMQNEMKSPKAGTVVELHAKVDATVNAGDVLVIVE